MQEVIALSGINEFVIYTSESVPIDYIKEVWCHDEMTYNTCKDVIIAAESSMQIPIPIRLLTENVYLDI